MLRRMVFFARISVLLLLALAACNPQHKSNPDALWKIVNDRCVPNQKQRGNPAPCEEVNLSEGYVVLKDRVGASQYLLMPATRTNGIESPALLQSDTPNYFAQSWQARHYTEARAPRKLAREDISLAVNSQYGRTQNHLHIHIDCLRSDVRDALKQNENAIGAHFTPFPFPLAGQHYLAMRVKGESLSVNPFLTLADNVPGAREGMGHYTLVVAGARFRDGTPGFYLLADRNDPATGDRASGEQLQDHDCR